MIATTASMMTITTTAKLMPTTVGTVLDCESGSPIVNMETIGIRTVIRRSTK